MANSAKRPRKSVRGPRARRRRLSFELCEERALLTGASIAGVTYLTANSSGFSPADTPQSGVAVFLYLDNGDTVLDPFTDTLVDASVSAVGTGAFEFDNVADGHYFVAENVPPGDVQSAGPAYYTVDVVNGLAVGNAATIDEFSSPDPETAYFIDAIDANPFQLTTTTLGGDIIGGTRDLTVNVLGPTNPISANGFVGTIGMGDGVFNLGTATSGPGTQVTMLYDAGGAGLGADLSAGGGNGFRFDFDYLQVGTGTTMDLNVTLVGPSGSATLSTTVAANAGAFSFFAPFTSFTPSGTFSFADVSSVQFDFNSSGVQDTDFEINQVVDTSLSFGNFPQSENTASSLSGFVYVDANDNGVFDSGEAPIAGVTVMLSGDDANGSVSRTTTTDANGFYDFNDLSTGTYTITETQPAGYLDGKDTIGTPGGTTSNDEFSNIALPAGFGGTMNNFGELLPSSLAGFVYVDANNNGSMDSGETPIAGVMITLTGTDDLGNSVSQSTNTDATGAYSFGDLRPGTYTLTETQPAGYLDGKDTIGTPGGTTSNDEFSNIVLDSGVDGVMNDFGELLPASLAGFVYVDANNNGSMDSGETPIAGVLVTLTGTDDLGDSVSQSTNTDATGAYSFGDLRPGTYTLTETQPAGYLDGKDTIGTPGGTTSNDEFSNIVLDSGVDGVMNDFGELLPSSLAGFVYVDANNNGSMDSGEAPISGVLVTLTGTDDLGDSVSQSTNTDATGAYSFGDLRPGTYTLTETQPAVYLDGKDTIGTPGGTTGNDEFSNIVLDSGVDGVMNDFGELLPSSLAGFVYVDANNNGSMDSGEAPIAGVMITLTGTDDLGNSVSQSTNTDATGAYSFGDLRPGTYTLTETQPAVYLDGKDTIGTPGGTTGNDEFSNIVLDSGVDGVMNDFGELLPASLSGFVYVDANNNGSMDSGEAPIAGVLVTLTGTDDLGNSVSQSTNTDATGIYAFGNLRPGTYTLTETQPAGYLDGKDSIGTQGGTTGNDVFSNIVLMSGVEGIQNDFGELLPASLSGYVYVDSNDNGSMDSGEAPIAGVLVTLTGTDDLGNSVSDSTDTDANGFYEFADLRPGTYTLTETQPAGYFDGKDSIGTQGGTAGNDVFSNIVLASGVDGTMNDFGELLPSDLSGYVYVDSNNSGSKDLLEPPIAGAVVTLAGTDRNGLSVFETAMTDANGYYEFTNLVPGTYTATETQPINFIDGKDSIGTQGGTLGNDVFSNIALASGIHGVMNDFGELGLTPAYASKRALLYPAQPVNLVAVNPPGTGETPPPADGANEGSGVQSAAATTSASNSQAVIASAPAATPASTPAAQPAAAQPATVATAYAAASAHLASTSLSARAALASQSHVSTAHATTSSSTAHAAATSSTSTAKVPIASAATSATSHSATASTSTATPAATSTGSGLVSSSYAAATNVSTSHSTASSASQHHAAVPTAPVTSTAKTAPASASTASASIKMFLVSLTKPKD